MSAAELNRIFKLIEDHYIASGTIDPHDREMLSEEMKHFDGADGFIQYISKVFDGIVNEQDDGGDSDSGTDSDASPPRPSGRDILRKLAGLPIYHLPTQPQKTKMRSRTKKFRIAVQVFNVFKFSCNVETETTEENCDHLAQGTSA